LIVSQGTRAAFRMTNQQLSLRSAVGMPKSAIVSVPAKSSITMDRPGSTPDGNEYDRDIVIVSTPRPAARRKEHPSYGKA
jgi:hypothetical protein